MLEEFKISGYTVTEWITDLQTKRMILTRKAEENKLNNVKTILRDFIANGTGLEDEGVDYVMLFNILCNENPGQLLNEAYRILKPNGKIGIIHWNYNSTTPRGPPMEMRLKPEQVIAFATKTGFNSPEKHNLKPYHYGVVMRKAENKQK